MEELSLLIKGILQEELKILKKYHIDHLGYRYFLPDGRSFGCPTIDVWYELPRSTEFYSHMSSYLLMELQYLYKNNFAYVTRSADHEANEYLNWLKKFKLDNSIGIYKFSPRRIDSVFFIYESNFGEQRDFLMNKMHILEKHVNTISRKIDKIFSTIQNFDDVELFIRDEKYNQIFSSIKLGKLQSSKYSNFIHEGETIILSTKEKYILKILATGENNKSIAAELGISERSVERHIRILKIKLKANSKNQLLKMANSPQLQAIL